MLNRVLGLQSEQLLISEPPSHWHLDHSGDPSTFPPTTSLIVGPGFKEFLLPGYPENPEGLILEADYKYVDQSATYAAV